MVAWKRNIALLTIAPRTTSLMTQTTSGLSCFLTRTRGEKSKLNDKDVQIDLLMK